VGVAAKTKRGKRDGTLVWTAALCSELKRFTSLALGRACGKEKCKNLAKATQDREGRLCWGESLTVRGKKKKILRVERLGMNDTPGDNGLLREKEGKGGKLG